MISVFHLFDMVVPCLRPKGMKIPHFKGGCMIKNRTVLFYYFFTSL